MKTEKIDAKCKQASTLAKLLFLRGNADIMQADDLPVASGKGRKRRLRCLDENVNSNEYSLLIDAENISVAKNKFKKLLNKNNINQQFNIINLGTSEKKHYIVK
jgi:hypothetical protein